MGLKKIKLVIYIVLALLFLQSCRPDCKDVTIQKTKWITRYDNYYILKDTVEEIKGYIDTLVSYSITEHRTKIEYKKNSSGEIKGSSCVHYITIKNNNESYSNRFAVKLTGKEYAESSSKWVNLNKTTDYISISPQSEYTFTIRHSSWWRNEASGYNESNVSIRILQEPVNIYRVYKSLKTITQKRTRRIDNLVISDTIVNDCECDVDALIEKYTTITEIFTRLKNEHLIITD